MQAGPPLRWPRGSAAPDTSPGRYRRWRVDHRRKTAPLPVIFPAEAVMVGPPLHRRGRHAAAAPRGGQSSAGSANVAPRIAEVVGASLHTVQLIVQVGDGGKWTLPSALSADGETVARVGGPHRRGGAEGGEQLRRRVGRLPDNLLIAASGNPLRAADADSAAAAAAECPARSRDRPGLSFYTAPGSAAFLGLERPSRLFCEASLPTESPA